MVSSKAFSMEIYSENESVHLWPSKVPQSVQSVMQWVPLVMTMEILKALSTVNEMAFWTASNSVISKALSTVIEMAFSMETLMAAKSVW